jgi:gliding motility-associated-like protein
VGPAAVAQWYWQIDTDPLDSGQSISRTYNQEDTLNVALWAESLQGCRSDTVTHQVMIQASHAYAGRDTAVALGYPIQLNATGGDYYEWTPASGLDNPDIEDPVANISTDTRYTVTAYSSAGCASYASIFVKVFKGPAIYVPGAFTPNGDGINDVLKIVCPGIRSLNYFRVYDRWGIEVFHSTDTRATWDGTVGGQPLPTGSYVWMISGVDFSGQPLSEKGTVMLIR